MASFGALAQEAGSAKAPAESAALQQLKAADPTLSEAAIRDLVARLSDAEVRSLLLDRLDAVAAPGGPLEAEGLDSFLERARRSGEAVVAGFTRMAAAVPMLPEAIPAALERIRDGRPASVYLWIALGFAVMMAVGWAAERLARRVMAKLFQEIVEAQPESVIARLGCLLLRLVLEFVSLGVYVGAALAVFFLVTHGHPVTRTVVMTYMAAVVVVRTYGIFSRFLLAPYLPALRLAHMGCEDARYLHRQNIVMASIAGFGFLTCSLLEGLGMPYDAHQVLTFSVGFVLCASVVYTIATARQAIAGDLNWDPENAGRLRGMLADIWPAATIAYTILLYLAIIVTEFTGGEASYVASFGSLLTVIFLPHLDAILERSAQRQEQGVEEGSPVINQLKIVVLRASRFVLCIAAALFLARIWGVDLFSLAEQGFGARIAGALIDIGLTGLVAYVLWELARITIDRRLAEEGDGEGEEGAGVPEPGEQGGQGVSRARTLLPLLRVAIQVTIVVMAVMLILSALGVNIGPLLAGAGVVGLAIGFGAQTLVRDIVSGVFFLVDDAFRLGEYIDVGVVKGTVEKISLRSLRLRHHRGALHTVPFGEIQHLTNYSRDWVVVKLEFRLPFDTDVNKVRKIFKRIGQELLEHEEIGPDFLAPFKSQGVFSTDDSALLIRGKFMAKPGRQFMIRREVYAAVQRAFAAEGIKFANRQVTVQVPGAEQMTPEQRTAVESAAASAVAQSETPAAAEAAAANKP